MSLRVEVVDAAVTGELRRAVLRPHWPAGRRMAVDDVPDAVHLAALDGEIAVGACVILPNAYPHRDLPQPWQLRAMATAENRRSEGIGSLVLDGAVRAARQRGGASLWCKARLVAVPFYERNGLFADTDVYVEPNTGLPHRDMYRMV